MTWQMHSTNSRFFMDAENRPAAYEAVMEAAKENPEIDDGALDMVELLGDHGFRADYDEDYNIIGIEFQRSKCMDNEFTLLQIIAPWVAPGSFIEMRSEDDDLWRWYFDGRQCIEQTGRVVYGEEELVPELAALLNKYDATIVFECGECSELADVYDEMIAVYAGKDKVLEVGGYSIDANDFGGLPR